MKPKFVNDENCLKYLEGSDKIEIEHFAVVYAHKELMRIISYTKSNHTMVHNLQCHSSIGFEDKLAEIINEFSAQAKQDFLNKVPHNLRVGDVFVAHENAQAMEKDLVHFYQILKVDHSNLITVMEIESDSIEFKDHFKCTPQVGRKKGVSVDDWDTLRIEDETNVKPSTVFQAEVLKSTFKTPEGYLAFNAKFSVLNITDGVSVKVYEPVSYGLVI